MGTLCADATALAPPELDLPGTSSPDGAASRFVVQREPPSTGGKPVFRCGHCLLPLADVQRDPALRCAGCGHRSALPARVWVGCDRCGFEQRVHTSVLAAESLCVSCGQPLVVADVVLTRLYRRHARIHSPGHRHHRGQRHRHGYHDRAVVLLLMLAAALFLSLKLLSQL